MGSNRHGFGGSETTTLTFGELLDTIAELPVEWQETLVDLVQLRLREQRRKEIARNAAEARAQFAAGQLPRGTVDDLLADPDVCFAPVGEERQCKAWRC